MLSVREMEVSDIELIADYFLNADPSYLTSMGVDIKKVPLRKDFNLKLSEQLKLPYEQKNFYYIIWMVDKVPVGHSSTNPTVYGDHAFMHLHLWNGSTRRKGSGTEFVKLTLSYYFNNLKLKKLYCQPYALNPAPNKTLEKIGFELVEEFTGVPGAFNFEQRVKKWEMSVERFEELGLNG